MPRYVILEHDHPTRHWDLMLESGGVLRTWRLAEPPRPGVSVAAEASFDHRPAYLDYEGPVGGRGTVTRWDGGTYEVLEEAEGLLVLRLEGQLRGVARLVREGGGWVFEGPAGSVGLDGGGGGAAGLADGAAGDA
jgi:DNA polymerase Ligase (LigD)